MDHPPSDRQVTRIVQRSAVFRMVRSVLTRIDAAIPSSAVARVVRQRPTLGHVGMLLLVASLTHALLVSFVPATLAPLGRYLFAIAGLTVAGAFLALHWRTRRG